MKLDNIDIQILQLLTQNARIQWKDLGEMIHMSGQAVGNRIKKLEDSGAIKAYSVIVDETKLGLTYTAFITIFMKTTDHGRFKQFISSEKEITEAHRISGGGCYHLKVKVDVQESLNALLDKILEFGNYELYLSINELKNANPMNAINAQIESTNLYKNRPI